MDSVQTVGTDCTAEGDYSVAEGEMSKTIKSSTSVEGYNEAKGAHAEGGNTMAGGDYSHTEGNSTVANNPYEHAEGHFNISHSEGTTYPNAKNTIHSVGIGSNITNRKNAEEIMQNGDKYVIGVGGFDGTNPYTSHTVQEAINLQHGDSFPTENLYDGQKFVLDKDFDISDATGKVSGVYKFNDIINSEFDLPATDVNFTSNAQSFVKIESVYGSSMQYVDSSGMGTSSLTYLGNWIDTSENNPYRVVDFGSTPQTISAEFDTWFKTCAVKQDTKSYKKGIYHYSSTLADWILDADVSKPIPHGVEFPIKPRDNQYFVLDEDIQGSPDPVGIVSGKYNMRLLTTAKAREWTSGRSGQYVNFKGGSQAFDCSQIWLKDDGSTGGRCLVIEYNEEHSGYLREYIYYLESYNWYPQGFKDEKSKIIDFGSSPQSVGSDFDSWFKSFAYKEIIQKGLYRYDSTLSDWVKVEKSIDSEITETSTNPVESKAIYELVKAIQRTIHFTGYMMSVPPVSEMDVPEGALWYMEVGEVFPTTFPWEVWRYKDGAWSSTTEQYTPAMFDAWTNLNIPETQPNGAYWFGGRWQPLDTDVLVDEVTMSKNSSAQLIVKDILSAVGNNGVVLGANTVSFSKQTWKRTGQIDSTVANDKTLTFKNGIKSDASGNVEHSNSITAKTTQTLSKNSYDAQGHITGNTDIGTDRGINITSNNIGHSNSVTAKTTEGLASIKYDAQGHITGSTAKTLGRGINESSNVIGHSNTAITAQSTQDLFKLSFDAYGHITGYTKVTPETWTVTFTDGTTATKKVVVL